MAKRKRVKIVSVRHHVQGGQSFEGETSNNQVQREQSSGAGASSADTNRVTEVESSHVTENISFDDSESAPRRKVRGPTLMPQVWDLENDQRIEVTLDENNLPIGEEGCTLTRFLGTLVRMPNQVSINHSDWREISKSRKEDLWSIVKEKFSFAPAETENTKDWVISNMGIKWRSWKSELKAKFFNSSLTVDELVEKLSDDRVNKEEFRALVTHWSQPEYQIMCEQKRLNRTKSDEPHCTGTKSFPRLSHEEAKKNHGVRPSRAEVYIRSRTRKSGGIVNPKAADVVVNLEAAMSSSDNQQNAMDKNWRHDDFFKVKGQEKRGYIRCVGKIPNAKGNMNASSSQQVPQMQAKIDQLEASLANTHSVLSSLLGLMKEHMPNADLARAINHLNMEIPHDINNATEL